MSGEVIVSLVMFVVVGSIVCIVGISFHAFLKRREIQAAILAVQPHNTRPRTNPFEGTFGELKMQWEGLREYGEKYGNPGKFQEWPQISEYACSLFGHPIFIQDTWDRLESWLLTYHARNREEMLSAQRTEIVRLLKEGTKRYRRH
jgi:hypothetical protein